MQQTILVPEKPEPTQFAQAEQPFVYRGKAQLAARRALLQLGHQDDLTLMPVYFKDQFGLPIGEHTMSSEFSEEFQAERQSVFDSQVRNLDVFVWGEGIEPIDPNSLNLLRTTNKLKSVLRQPRVADKKYRAFLEVFSSDIGVPSLESEWHESVKEDPDWLRLNGDTMSAESLAARVNFAYQLDPSEANRLATENSRVRGERFVKEYGETIKNAVEKFPELANAVLADLNITDEQTLAVVKKRFDEVKHRVVVTSYLEEFMPADANGAYYGRAHAAYLNADYLLGSTKEEVEHVVFHELWHAVSAQNNVSCKDVVSEEANDMPLGTGIPHATWLTEGVTDLLARRTMQKLYADQEVGTGAYHSEVAIVTNIIENNPKIQQLLLEGNVEDMSAGQAPGKLKTSRAVALIEKVYGTGFVQHVEQSIDKYRVEPDKEESAKLAAEILNLTDYTKNPKLAKKALRIAGKMLGYAGGSVVFGLGVLSALDHTTGLEFPSETEHRTDIVWQNTTPAQIESVVALNTQQGTDVGAVYIKDGYVEVMDDGLRTGHYDNPIYFEDSAGEAYAGFMSDGQFTVKKLGLQDDGDSVLIMIPEENSAAVAVPVIEDGRLVDRESGQELGSDAYELIEPASSP